jgi:uncharacterized damage-inducible protein DinB
MAKYKSEDLLNSLIKDVQRIKESAQFFQSADPTKLAFKPAKDKWSVVQTLEHVNAYNRHYLPLIEKEVSVVTKMKSPIFASGYWGDLFTKKMKPTNVYEIKNKMKTMKAFDFPNSLHVETVLKEYLSHQDHLLRLLEMAKERDLNAIRIPITITSLIRLKLGDLFRFLIAHEQRHMIQARNTLKETGVTTERFPVILQATQ